ncbi:Acyl-coenzyme A:6-aminopenicillanic acid acyl-transferase [compost metagenome]
MKKILLISLTSFFSQVAPSTACTIFIACNKQTVLVGNNEDYTPTVQTFLWVRPQQQNTNGYVFWGFEEQYPEGGMNDKGLFYDVAVLPQKAELIKDPKKADFEGYIVEKVLRECSTVEDVIKLVSKYNLTWYEKAQILVADKFGDYAIINASYIIRPTDKKFTLTNYNLANPANKDFKCWRRNTANQLLNNNPCTVDLFTKILENTAQHETDNATLYSQICDLRSNTIYLYQRGNFSQVKKIDLPELLKAGKQVIEINDLFPKRITDELITIYKKDGITKTIEFYQGKRRADIGYTFTENDIEQLGYQLLDSNKVADAISLLTVNLQYYPNSEKANAALANAYLKDGNKVEANKCYKKALDINPASFYPGLFGQSDSITFRIKGMQGADKIALVGTFNNYDPKANLFTRTKDGWSCTIKIPPGEFAYKFNIDDTFWIQDPANQLHVKPTEWWDSYLKVE